MVFDNDKYSSAQHGDIEVVAINDPFIEPTYAVSLPPQGIVTS